MIYDLSDAVLMQYEAEEFQYLNAFHIAKRFITEHQHSLIELGDVICRHNLQGHVGISLLHKHFDISNEELVVREFTNGIAYIKPRSVGDITDVVPYLWKCMIANQQALYYPLEFSEYSDHLQQEARQEVEVIAGSKDFLIEIAEKLGDLDLTAVFGIAALCSREALALGQEETLLETTDEERRILTLRPAAQAEVDQLDTTQTLWIFTPSRVEVARVFTGVNCSSHCGSHCHAHCVNHAKKQSRELYGSAQWGMRHPDQHSPQKLARVERVGSGPCSQFVVDRFSSNSVGSGNDKGRE